MDLNKIFQHEAFKIILIVLVVLITLSVVFSAGMAVGFRKAGFSYRWGENYHKNFAGPRGGFFREFGGKDFIDANGVFGQIVKISSSTLVINGRDGVEKVVVVKDDTIIKSLRESIKLSGLKIGDAVVIMGEPNDSAQIEATLVRVMPGLPAESPLSGSRGRR